MGQVGHWDGGAVGCAPQLQLYNLLWRRQRRVTAGELECKMPLLWEGNGKELCKCPGEK